MDRNHFGKRRKCWLPAFSPFPKMFSKTFFLGVVKSRDCVVKRLDGITFDNRLAKTSYFDLDEKTLLKLKLQTVCQRKCV